MKGNMDMLKKLLGLAPKLESDDSYSPSKIASRLATVDKTDELGKLAATTLLNELQA